MSITSTEKKRRFIMFALLGLAVAAVLVVGGMILFAPQKPPVMTNIASTRSDAVKGQAGGEGSDEYNRKLEAHDQQKANAALTAGESYIPTPVGTRTPTVTRKPDTPPPPPVTQPRVASAQTPRTDNTLLKRMMEDLAALDARLSGVSVGEGKIVFVSDLSKDKPLAAPAAVTVSEDTPSSSAVALKPGDMLYAVIDTGVNSDVPSAVMGTVASGKFKNARLLGKFQRFEERLVLSFSRIILPDGSTSQIEGYAVDPATSEASVASSVGSVYIQFAVYGIATVGVIGIIRGLCLLRDTPNQAINFSRAIVHLFGGIIAVNIVTFLRGIGATLGGDVQTTIAKIIG